MCSLGGTRVHDALVDGVVPGFVIFIRTREVLL
jgi:hypothetical protein